MLNIDRFLFYDNGDSILCKKMTSYFDVWVKMPQKSVWVAHNLNFRCRKYLLRNSFHILIANLISLNNAETYCNYAILYKVKL